MKYSWFILSFCILTGAFFVSCNKEEAELYAGNSKDLKEKIRTDWDLKFEINSTPVSINTSANANDLKSSNIDWIRNISGSEASYCHPDIEYFPEGFNGYKYWMVFTPYFGKVGIDQFAKRYENPTVVVSNDGLNWKEPNGIINPIQKCPSISDSFRELKKEPIQGFWSDVDWLFTDGRFELYYRGTCITGHGLQKIGAKSVNNYRKSRYNARRTIVRQVSNDGIHWDPLEIIYNSNPPTSPKNSFNISPTFLKINNEYISYEVELNSGKKHFKTSEPSFVIRRTSNNGIDFTDYPNSNIVRFLNTPWDKVSADYSPWHIQATYLDGNYFMIMAVGNVKKYTSEQIYFAYSPDGYNFYVYPQPLINQNAYRSALFPIHSDNNLIKFGCMIGYKSGEFQYAEIKLKKQFLEESFNSNN